MTTCRFYLGTHKPHWLAYINAPPLFVSRRRLSEYKVPPRAATAWALDSGGFSELSLFGKWVTTPEQYVREVRRWSEEVGQLDWAAAMDWMCEPHMIAKTGLSVAEHQRRTVENFSELRDRAPEVPWLPVLQGWHHDDYLRCVSLYEKAGVALDTLPAVGLGSVCRRQHTRAGEDLIRDLSAMGIRIHAFGFKTEGLLRCQKLLASADSMAWSYDARMSQPMAGCPHQSCANCFRWARRWYDRLTVRLIRDARRPKAQPLFT